MNINKHYFLFTQKFVPHVLNLLTGEIKKVVFAYKTPATDEIFDGYNGHVGYIDTEYNVWRVEETGEEFVYPFSYGYADPAEVMNSDRAKEMRAAQSKIVPTVKHDGFDGLRKDLSPVVTMSAQETFTGTFVVTLTIPNPVQYHRSFFALCELQTTVTKTFYFADFKRWNGKALEHGKIEDWRLKAQSAARQMLESAQHDPVSFFKSNY